MVEESSATRGIILKRWARKEADAALVVFTRDFGKLDLVARGLQKANSKLAGHLEPLNLVELLLIKGKHHDYIGSALTVNSFFNLKTDLNKLYFAGQAIFLFNQLVKPGQEDKALFFLLEEYLEFLDSLSGPISKEKGSSSYNFFVLKLLIELGSGPEMFNCLVGAEKIAPGQNYFSLRRGGLVCHKCLGDIDKQELLRISDNTIKLFRLAPSLDFYKIYNLSINKLFLKEFSLIIKAFLEYHYNFS
ncbi:MAG: DNA repair protein RecO [Candidatus Falkowbacteria bacterium]|nr:DNA repair protein RecO [Candidatus Falkowbacteria bacterium]